MSKIVTSLVLIMLSLFSLHAQTHVNGQLWPDTDGKHINAHGGNIIKFGDTYYWYGEHRPYTGFTTERGISVYSSKDMKTWKNEGIALAVSRD